MILPLDPGPTEPPTSPALAKRHDRERQAAEDHKHHDVILHFAGLLISRMEAARNAQRRPPYDSRDAPIWKDTFAYTHVPRSVWAEIYRSIRTLARHTGLTVEKLKPDYRLSPTQKKMMVTIRFEKTPEAAIGG